MAIKIRLARGGSKKRPYYRIVAADSRMPRDGRYIERLGTYDPLLPKDSEARVSLNVERIKHWLGEGAQTTDRVARFLEAAGVVEKTERANPNKAKPGKKALARVDEKATKAANAAEAAAAAPVEKPAVEEVAEEAPEQEATEETTEKTTEKAVVEKAAETTETEAPAEKTEGDAATNEEKAAE